MIPESGTWSAVFLILSLLPPPITIHLAGDSTMAEKKAERRPETGWGEMLQPYFDLAQVRIENHAKNGRSTRTFLDEGLWQQLIENVKQGDYVFIQFGHNDEVPSKTDRYTPPEQYRQNLVRFIADVRARRATPVLLTPVARRKFDKQGNVVESHREYSAIVRAVAREQNTPLIDMDQKSAVLLARNGVEGSKHLFLQLDPGASPNYPQGITDNTHFSPAGAQAMAALAIEGIRELKLDLAKQVRAPAAEMSQRTGLLADQRIAQLGERERAAWQRYLGRSDSIKRADQQAMAAELKEAGAAQWTPAPTGSGFFMQKSMTADWFRTRDADSLARMIVSYQAPNGGWSKRIAYTHTRKRGEAFTSADNTLWLSTIDNGSTTEQLNYLANRLATFADSALLRSYQRGIAYLLNAQFPNGCWPQVFPLAGGYHDAITYNDDATVHALETLSAAAQSSAALVGARTRTQAAMAVERGVDCILKAQVVVNGRKTVWGAQHDPITFEPVKARAYEHPSLSGRESGSVVDFLMKLENPSPEVIAAVHAAAAWFRANAITGYAYVFRGDLTPKADAPPLWARFYEIGSNRPIFSDRDGVIRYDLREVGPERRYGYMWYSDEPAAMLRRYQRWARAHPQSN